jgi:long-chain acyl-CoA synthetase
VPQVQYLLMLGGGRCGFYSGNVMTLAADMQLLRPTVFVSVPRVLNKVRPAKHVGDVS